MHKHKNLFLWLDVIIGIALLLTAFSGLLLWLGPSGERAGGEAILFLARRTWTSLHDFAGLLLLGGALLHLTLHWEWIACVLRRFFGKTSRAARINFVLDTLLFSAILAAGSSGLIVWFISSGRGFRGGRNPFYTAAFPDLSISLSRDLHLDWHLNLHLVIGLIFIGIVCLHLALHAKWLACITRQRVQTTAGRTPELPTYSSTGG